MVMMMAIKVIFDNEKCKGCKLCVSVCPKSIIKIKNDKLNSRGYYYAEIENIENCIGCSFCAQICPDCVIAIIKE